MTSLSDVEIAPEMVLAAFRVLDRLDIPLEEQDVREIFNAMWEFCPKRRELEKLDVAMEELRRYVESMSDGGGAGVGNAKD